MSKLKAKIGLEVHVQLATKTKLFCGCSTQASKPNTATCPTCLGLPGAKPVLNKRAIEFAIKLALALNSKVQPEMAFSRKTYFYPDMSKNYQITQYEKPLALGGFVKVGNRKIRLRRIHIEEDPASLKHPDGITGSKYVLVDYNRSGTPLCEIVTEPDIRTPKEARKFLASLLSVLNYLGIYDPENYSLRTDVNISIKGQQPIEIKEITGAKEIEKALSYEIIRQDSIVSNGGKIKKETRHYDSASKSTVLLREKETEEEYGYIYDSDLPTFKLREKQIAAAKKSMPELPQQKKARLQKEYKISAELATQLATDKELSDCYESVAKVVDNTVAAKWFTGYLLKTLRYNELAFKDTKLTARQLKQFFSLLKAGKITDRGGELLLRKLVLDPQSPKKLAQKENLLAISDAELKKIVKKVLKENSKASKEFKEGKKKALKFLVGKVMSEAKGRAAAKTVKKMLRKYITW